MASADTRPQAVRVQLLTQLRVAPQNFVDIKR
jgi:hypothetical protein